MSKKSSTRYTKGTMKTLDAKALKARKDNLQAEFDREKGEALKCSKIIEQATKKRDAHIGKMNDSKAAFEEIERLEKSIGIDPLSTRASANSTESGAKKK